MITVEVRYFARLREAFGCERETLALGRAPCVADLLALLRARGGVWAQALEHPGGFRVAVNQALADETRTLEAGDEVALFPPVTGG